MLYSTPESFKPIIAEYDKVTKLYKVVEDFTFEWRRNGKTYRFTIPAGFEYDKASVPGIIPPIVAREDGPWDTASALHDAAYKYCQHGGIFPSGMYQMMDNEEVRDLPNMTRADADWLLGYVGRLGGASALSATIYKWSVKLFPINWFKGF